MVTPILVSVLLVWGCAGAVHSDEKSSGYLSKQKRVLTDKQIQSLDAHAAKELPECNFLYSKSPVGTVTGDVIYKCIDSADNSWFGASGHKSLGLSDEQLRNFHGQYYTKSPSGTSYSESSSFHVVDDYLGKKLLPYILAIPRQDQEKLFHEMTLFHFSNLAFIETLVEKGISPKYVLLSRVGDSSPWASCEGYMFILDKNIGLYEDKKTLYEPVQHRDAGSTSSYSYYRWMDLFHLTDPANNICPEVIERLVRASPELLNKRDPLNMATPLNQFLAASENSPRKMQVIKILTTPVNINLKNNAGDTPLHTFLKNENPDTNSSGDPDKQVVKWLIEQGANINLKDKQGISVKELLLKRPDLSGLLK